MVSCRGLTGFIHAQEEEGEEEPSSFMQARIMTGHSLQVTNPLKGFLSFVDGCFCSLVTIFNKHIVVDTKEKLFFTGLDNIKRSVFGYGN